MIPNRCFAIALAGLCLPAPPARALINLNYTPVDLVRQSELILRLRLGEPAADGKLAVTVVQALQGKAPAKLVLVADKSLRSAARDEQKDLPFQKGRQVAALLFGGDFSSAAAGSDAEATAGKPVGMLHVDILPYDTRWFALFAQPDGSLRVGTDPLDLKQVWAGGHEMLRRAVAYIQADPRADVPVVAGIEWGGEAHLGKLAGRVHGATAVNLDGSGKLHLLVLCEGGDRLYAPAGAGKLEDATARCRLTTKSHCAAWGDFDADGRLDLASWDGKSLSVALRRADGTFDLKAGAGGFGQTPVGLAAISPGRAAATSLLVSTPAEPLVMTLAGNGLFAHKPLPEAPQGAPPLGAAGACLAGDFDADGLTDVLQPFARGALLYRGAADGTFAAPSRAADVGPGAGAAAVAGDFDADGLLDVLLTGKGGACLLRNLGRGRFGEVLHEAGEVEYTSQRIAGGAALFDINNDGRQEFLLTRTNMPAAFYFSRGFACFGYAKELELRDSRLKGARAAEPGQQAAAVGDFNGDGAQDVAFVAANGEVWLLYRGTAKGAVLGLTVSLSPGAPGPVNVTAADGKRSLGVRVLAPGASVLFGKLAKGPLDLTWRLPGGKEQARRIIVVRPTRLVLAAAAVPAVPALETTYPEFAMPAGSGFTNVRSDCGARGDGAADDTDALEKAVGSPDKRIKGTRAIYIPNGTYRISRPLVVGDKKKYIQGQSRQGVILKLKDNCPGFGDPRRPAFMLHMKGRQHFAQNFYVHLHNVTFDVGSGNGGAAGVMYHTNNGGMLSNVAVRSSDPKRAGAVGIAMDDNPGNGMVREVFVDGLDVGVQVTGGMHGMYLEHVIVANQRVAGFVNRGNTVALRGLVSRNAVPAVDNSGFLALIDCDLSGGAADAPAVRNTGALFARNIRTAGYATAIVSRTKGSAKDAPGPRVEEFSSSDPVTLFDSASKSLNLPVEDVPKVPLEAPGEWANVKDFGAQGDNRTDDTAAIQKAVDSGKAVVYLPFGLYVVRDTIRIRGGVRRFLGPCYVVPRGFKDADRRSGDFQTVIKYEGIRRPVFRLEDGKADTVVMDGLMAMYGDAYWAFDHASKRTWALNSCYIGAYINTVPGGKAILNDFSGEVHAEGQKLYVRNLNTETYVHTHNTNRGGDLWILGIKTEKDRTVVDTTAGGRTELFGGFIYKNRQRVGPAPMFTSTDAAVCYNYKAIGVPYAVQVRQTRGGQMRELTVQQTRGQCVLFVGSK